MNPVTSITLLILLVVVAIIIYAVIALAKSPDKRYRRRHELDRHSNNPVLSPRPHHDWDAEGAFNPGAVVDDEGKVHLFYRAIGRDGISRIGHAMSPDGFHFETRSSYPVFQPMYGCGLPDPRDVRGPHTFDRSAHASGGGWGGSEDPRVTRIGDRIFMTYTAFEGWANMRIGLTSIAEKDMRRGIWRWKRPVLISPENARAKNWVLFPEKINGQYAILHALAPKIKIAYVDTPEITPSIESVKDHGGGGYADPARKGFWDERVRGAGTPPIKTDLGWLLLYHAIDARNPKNVVGYKVGAMILDLHDPSRIVYRSPEPILSPDMPYENDGKPGVVYATGAVVKDGNLLVYYGGGDKHTCVAKTPMDALLNWLTTYGRIAN